MGRDVGGGFDLSRSEYQERRARESVPRDRGQSGPIQNSAAADCLIKRRVRSVCAVTSPLTWPSAGALSALGWERIPRGTPPYFVFIVGRFIVRLFGTIHTGRRVSAHIGDRARVATFNI
ncbi:unnamed protein product, partial [Iphiclides podalirius]